MLRFGARAALRTATLVVITLTAGCSLDSSALSTGALFGSDKPKLAPARPETPEDRLIQVATTSARAQRCGYVFDPAAVRTNYLAYESGNSNSPEQLAKIQQGYDFTFAKVLKATAGEEDYCSDGTTNVIKRDLGKVLAGDFTSPAAKAEVSSNYGRKYEPIDREKIFEPQPMR